MEEKKRFQKKTLSSDDYKAIENAAKATKGFLGSLIAVALLVFNRDNIETFGKGAMDITKKAIKK